MTIDVNQPAKNLEGVELENDWIVGKKIIKDENSGFSFFVSYNVSDGKRNAILKALDFSIALLNEDDPSVAMNQLTEVFNFQKNLHELCASKKLSKVVTILDKGIKRPIENSIIPVPYLILEYVDSTVKNVISFDSRLNIALLLKVLHNVSTGLAQLHGQGIAHKNIKPENILFLNPQLQKISELGKSDMKGRASYSQIIGSDPSYLPPEVLYGESYTGWKLRSQAFDLYQLGSLISFLFTNSHFNTWLIYSLDNSNPKFKPSEWGGSFEQVLPYLENAYDWAITEFFTPYLKDISTSLKEELELALRQLCHPDPKRRGHPKNIESRESSYSTQRYISLFNRLSKQAENNLLK